jgi:hypothetical protein
MITVSHLLLSLSYYMMTEQPDEGKCAFFLQKKKRYCRFRPTGNAKYCPEHAGVLGVIICVTHWLETG